jgi:hypothetical protein
MFRKSLVYIGCALCCLNAYAQRQFTVASPFADVIGEQKRLDSLGYRNAYEYELADSTLPNGKRYLMGRYEYGVDGVVAAQIAYGFDTDSTAWYYAYTPKGKVTQVAMISRRAIIQSSYFYNKKTSRLDSIIVTKGPMYKQTAKYNKNGTLGEFDVQLIDIIPDTTSKKKKKFKRTLTPYERIVVAYDTNNRPIADTTYSAEGLVKIANIYSYDEAGRMASHMYHEPGNAAWAEEYMYDDRGSLYRRIHFDATTGTRTHFVMAYR